MVLSRISYKPSSCSASHRTDELSFSSQPGDFPVTLCHPIQVTKQKGSVVIISCGSKLVLIRSRSKMAFFRSVVLLQALLLAVENAAAKPIPLITRQTIEEEYDFVICGGSYRTISLTRLSCALTFLTLTFAILKQAEQLALS